MTALLAGPATVVEALVWVSVGLMIAALICGAVEIRDRRRGRWAD